MLTPKRRARWGTLCIVGAWALSGAWRLKQVAAAHAEEPLAPRPAAQPRADGSSEPSPLKRATPPLQLIPAGSYLPFYQVKSAPQPEFVPAFRIATQAVTARDFLDFVRENPRWQRSRVERLFAEASYLEDWSSDSSLGATPSESAVGKVSWFAAKAYCASLGLRLPSTVEWERAFEVLGWKLAATSDGATRDSKSGSAAALRFEWTRDFNSLPLAAGDAAESTASLLCGAGARVTNASDYDAFLRYSFRSSLKADFALKSLGFRCAGGAP